PFYTRQREVTRTGVPEIAEAKIAAFHMSGWRVSAPVRPREHGSDRAEAPGGIDGVPALRRAQLRGRQVLQCLRPAADGHMPLVCPCASTGQRVLQSLR